MTIGYLDDSYLSDIADAIRAKTGDSASMTVAEMPDEIASISGGGGGSVEVKEINFVDYDGTLIASYDVADLPLSALPDLPDHSNDEVPLTPNGWNYTLAEVNAIEHGAIVGATYEPTDGKAHIIVECGIFEFPLWFLACSGNTTVEWGDGTSETFASASSKKLVHTYANWGRYDIAISTTAQAKLYGGNAVSGRNYINFTGDYSTGKLSARAVKHVYMTSSITPHTYSFANLPQLRTIMLPNGDFPVVLSGDGMLTYIVVPKGVTSLLKDFAYNIRLVLPPSIPTSVVSMGSYALSSMGTPNIEVDAIELPPPATTSDTYCASAMYGARAIYIKQGATTIVQACFNACKAKDIYVPDSVTEIAANAFYTCDRLHMAGTTPPTLSATNAVSSVNRVFVPYSADHSVLEAYKTETNWSTIADRIIEEESGE